MKNKDEKALLTPMNPVLSATTYVSDASMDSK